jgi:5-methylcytosine-specific restriction endonuclease McrA
LEIGRILRYRFQTLSGKGWDFNKKAMKKADRQRIFDKYGGRCAYCGVELTKGWHVDELEPCRRNYTFERGHWSEPWTRGMSEDEMAEKGVKWIGPRDVFVGYTHPERMCFENQMPACASCNINKHSMSLEEFRAMILGFMKHLNEINTQYKIAKRYGLVIEDIKPVVFYFEKVNNQP